MNKQRMIMLADLLDNVKPMQFNMTDWFSVWTGNFDDYKDDEDLYSEADGDAWAPQNVMVMNGYDCQAAACIAGWAVVLKNDFALNNPNQQTVNYSSNNTGWETRLRDGDMPVMTEAMEYLGLTLNQARTLFVNDISDGVWERYSEDLGEGFYSEDISLTDITPKMAAKMLRNLATGEWSWGNIEYPEDVNVY